jgi:hypothetical protein
VRSEQPSAWACDETRPNPPLAPLDVKVQPPAHVTDKAPRVSWNTPDQSNWRRIDTYVIERQSPPEPGRPWLLDKTVAGPAGAQTLSTKLAFSVAAEPPPSDGKYAYRVCSENAGGRTCAAPVVIALTVNPTIQGTATRSDAATQRVPASSPADTKAIKHGGNTAIDRRLATIQTNQIICQGGATLLIEELKGFSSKNDGGNTLRLFFSPAWNGAGADGERLKPGECGFVDRGWNPLDPPGIFFETRRGGDPETDRLATYMRSAGHYWSFIAENTGQGSFQATRHAQWKGEKPAAPTDRSGARPRLPGGKKL